MSGWPDSNNPLVGTTGFEPATPWFVARCPIHWATGAYVPPARVERATSAVSERCPYQTGHGGMERRVRDSNPLRCDPRRVSNPCAFPMTNPPCAAPTGLEPATSALTGQCSNLLSYDTMMLRTRGAIRTRTGDVLNVGPLPWGYEGIIGLGAQDSNLHELGQSQPGCLLPQPPPSARSPLHWLQPPQAATCSSRARCSGPGSALITSTESTGSPPSSWRTCWAAGRRPLPVGIPGHRELRGLESNQRRIRVQSAVAPASRATPERQWTAAPG
jgi:hypothetical protein